MTETTRDASTHYQVVVLGAGPGGYVAAIRAAQLGRKVAIIEARHWGGVCLNVGCIPSKALLRNAEVVRLVCHEAEAYGLTGEMHASYSVAHDRSRKVARGRAQGINYLMKKNGITQIDGWAHFVGPHALEIDRQGSPATITFEHAIVATGARPKMLPAVALSQRIVTYEELILDPRPPESIVIIGAGAIGMEFAYILSAYGAEVTILEQADRVLPMEDRDSSRELENAYRKLGITVATSAHVDSVSTADAHGCVVFSDKTNAMHTLMAEKVLLATGFEANVEKLSLELAGVQVDPRGAIIVDEWMRTSAAHIFAIGDVTMKMPLAHVAEAMGVVAAETIAQVTTMELGDYRMMPRATFCRPQVASFGLTEEQARAEHDGVRVAKFPMSANGKAHALGEVAGLIKLIADHEGALLGGHLVGPDVAELLPELTLAQKWELGSFELSRNVHVHPSLSEAIQEAIHGLEGHMINI